MTTTADQPNERPKRNVTYSGLMIGTSAALNRVETEIAIALRAGNHDLASRLADRALRMAGY